jgi:NAD(P)-dependent dehydrogenase (short-subunit alcohol dehydrogenase family)
MHKRTEDRLHKCSSASSARLRLVDDVVDLIEFLCSDGSSYITGQDIVVDGGLNLQYSDGVIRNIVPQNL